MEEVMSVNYLWTVVDVVWQFFFKGDYDSTNRRIGQRRSIVRKIGSALPLSPAPRPQIDSYVKCKDNGLNDIYSTEHLSDDGIDCVSDSDSNDCNNLSYARMSEIHHLQEELKLLKLQVASILENQKNSIRSPKKEKEMVRGPPVPPPLPPPPPPMLPNLLTPFSTPLKIGPRRTVPRYNPNTPVNALSEVLKELAGERPKLRHVERSPGGRPIKAKVPSDDPSDVLTEVLKRRFSMVQLSDANESDTSTLADPISP